MCELQAGGASMISKEKIQCFLTLAETLSFTETANRLYMAQQGVSKTIAQIEKKMDIPLFYRNRKEVRLTPAGEEFYTLFSSFIESYNEIEDKYISQAKNDELTIKIGYIDWLNLGSPFTLGWSRIHKERPDVCIMPECRPSSQLTALLADGSLDMIITQKRFVRFTDEMKYLTLSKTKLQLLVSPEHPLARKNATAETFKKETILISPFVNESPEETGSRVEHELDMAGLGSSNTKLLPSRDSMYYEAEQGQGVIIATEMNQNNTLNRYALNAVDELICIWQESPKEPLIKHLAKIWQEEFSAAQED